MSAADGSCKPLLYRAVANLPATLDHRKWLSCTVVCFIAMATRCMLSSTSYITAKTSAASGRSCNSSNTMLAGMMWSLASQQRRLITGHKHISFSRDTGAAASLLRTQATTTEHSSRRRRRPTEADQQLQQQPVSQTKGREAAAKQQLERSPKQDAGSRAEQQHKQARDQITQQSASSLGLVRAADVAGRSRKQQPSSSQLPWSPTSPQQQPTSPHSPLSSTDDSASTVSDSTVSSSSYAASSSRRSSSSSSSSNSSSEDSSVLASPLGSLQLSDEEYAIIAATNRISRFMDFRERCASEVVNKLTDLGYDKQFAYQVLQRMQETVGTGWRPALGVRMKTQAVPVSSCSWKHGSSGSSACKHLGFLD